MMSISNDEFRGLILDNAEFRRLCEKVEKLEIDVSDLQNKVHELLPYAGNVHETSIQPDETSVNAANTSGSGECTLLFVFLNCFIKSSHCFASQKISQFKGSA